MVQRSGKLEREEEMTTPGQYYDALMHRHTLRALPRLNVTAAESGRGPARWWASGDVWVGLSATFAAVWICLIIIKETML